MLEHLSREETTIIFSRAAFYVGIAVLAFGGLFEPFGLDLKFLIPALLWILTSTLLMLNEKNLYNQMSLVQHLVDCACMILLVWHTGKLDSNYIYVLPFLVFPAGLLVSASYSLLSTVALLLFSLFLAIGRPLVWHNVAFWSIFYGFTLMTTLNLILRRKAARDEVIRFELERQAMLSDKRANVLEDRLSEQKITDDVTGLSNFKYFRARIEEEIKRSKRYKHNFSLCAMGIDGLDEFEREYGAVEKDLVLERVARQLKKEVRDTDHLARYMKNQFLIMLVGSNPKQSIIPSRRIAERIRGITFGAETKYTFKVSCGIAGYPDDAQDIGGLVGLASSSLNKSRERGPGSITLASALYRTLA